MKYWKAGLLFLIAFILQSGAIKFIAIAGRTPNIILALVIVLSFLYENKLYGFVYGALFGVLYDICFGQVIGETAIPLAIIALVIFCLNGIYNVENIINLSLVSAGTIVGYSLLNWVMLSLAGNPTSLARALIYMPISWIQTFILIIILYYVFIRDVIKYIRQDRKLI